MRCHHTSQNIITHNARAHHISHIPSNITHHTAAAAISRGRTRAQLNTAARHDTRKQNDCTLPAPPRPPFLICSASFCFCSSDSKPFRTLTTSSRFTSRFPRASALQSPPPPLPPAPAPQPAEPAQRAPPLSNAAATPPTTSALRWA